ncbi:D-alanyl-D-alanine carboxypeptidase/D-alanyl-D-alanine endopeptidase [Ferrimonas pelagia]|uniref:Serine-type D-Ala-D-Ala carboxypeptidase n=1 Tax=Ferrimonas pelagia TaxID=1177826 RepID=A0ABP9FIU7_9GAMM
MALLRYIGLVIMMLPAASHAQYRDFETLLPQGSQLALAIYSANGEPEYQYRSEALMAPASTLKLLTASAAWLQLGADFRYRTQLLGPAPDGHRLPGDLVLSMVGDPTFERADLYRMLQQLKQQGVDHIDGDLLIQGLGFSGYDRAPGWPWDDLGICYAAQSSAVILDGNCARVWLRIANDTVRIDKPAHLPLRFSHNVQLGNGTESCPLEMQRHSQNHYQLSGCIDKPTPLAIAIDDPGHYVSQVVSQQLLQLGITLAGSVRHVDAPLSTAPKRLLQHQSQALPALLTRVLQDSNNQISDSLLRTLAHDLYQQDASFQLGIQAMKSILQRDLGLAFDSGTLFDGSGLSRYNLLSADQLASLLTHWLNNPKLSPLLELLPVSGESGTLKYRRSLKQLPYKVSAKTGSFNQVSNLAGIVQRPDQAPVIVVQLVNGIAGDPSVTQDLLSQFEHHLYQCIQTDCFAPQQKRQRP